MLKSVALPPLVRVPRARLQSGMPESGAPGVEVEVEGAACRMAVAEEWEWIAGHLFAWDVLSAAQVCRSWREMVEDAAVWSCRSVAAAARALDACEAAAAAQMASEQDAKGRTRVVGRSKIYSLEVRPKYVNFVYGEIGPESVARMLGACGARRGMVIADLGSGSGRLLANAASLVPLEKVLGIELLEGYHQGHTRVLHSYFKLIFWRLNVSEKASTFRDLEER